MRLPFSRFLSRSFCTGGADVIRKEAWPSCRISSGVRLCWELEEPKGPKGGVEGSGFKGLGFRVQGSGFRVQGSGFRI
jgi:hypothetical protein